MTGEQRNSYAALTGLMADNLEPSAPFKKNAYSTFVALFYLPTFLQFTCETRRNRCHAAFHRLTHAAL